MAGKSKTDDSRVEATQEIYRIARAEADTELAAMREEIDAIRIESQAFGAMQAIGTTIAFQELMKAITLHRIKENKEYKKGGLTWEAFCESLGLERRTVDMMLSDIKSIVGEFSGNFSGFAGLPFSKIRLLGKAIAENISGIENNCLVYNGESIPLTPENKEDIEAILDALQEEIRSRKVELDATVSAKDKVLKSKEDVINKQERDLKRFEKDAAKRGLTLAEDAYLKRMEEHRITFDGYMLQLEPNYQADLAPSDGGTPRMHAAYITTLDYMRQQIVNAHLSAQDLFGDDLDGWQPPVQG